MKILLIIEYILNIVAIFLILVILSGRKEARATFAWVLTLIFIPIIGILAYIIIGNPRIKRILDINLKKGVKFPKDYPKLSEAEVNYYCNIVTTITKNQPLLITELELLENAAIKFSKLSKDILNAEKYIFVEYYIIRNDETGEFFINLLSHKAKNGVKVYILLDWVGSLGIIRSKMVKKFISCGGKIAFFHSPDSFKTFSMVNFRNHRKIVIIDGKICYTGGINIGNEYLGKYSGMDEWIDCHVRFSGSVVREMENIFCEDWYYTVKEDLTSLLSSDIDYDVKGGYAAHVIPSGPEQDINFIYESLLSLLCRVEKEITIITPYLVPDETVINMLKNISRLGKKVKIIVPGKNNHPIVGAAGRSYYDELLEAGVKIYETKYMLHSKLILFDHSVVSVGTANMDNRSMKLNFEVNLLIYSEKFADYVENLALHYMDIAREITIQDVENLPSYKRIFYGICRVFSPII